MYLYPENLTARPMLWLWTLRDVAWIGTGLLLSVLALTQTGSMIPLVITAVLAFLCIRHGGISMLDFLRYEADFIRSHWLNRRTTDCVGLIKGYGWLNTVTMEIQYGSNGMPDVGADGMYYNAGRKGSIETMPDTPGLAVWKSGHIGVYIGSGEVIEAMDTRYGVVKTKLQGRGWTHWLEVPGIKYD